MNRITFKKIINFLLVLFFLAYLVFYFFSSFITKYKSGNTLTSSQINVIQMDCGFKLPEGAYISSCRLDYGGTDADVFTTVICGISNVDEFIDNNFEFEVKRVEGELYYTSELDSKVRENHYYGFYNGRINVKANTDSEIIIEISRDATNSLYDILHPKIFKN